VALKGKVFKYGDNVDTDVIIPARYLNTSDPQELAAHCMEDIDATFSKRVKPGDIIVAGENFGCGSSREHAPLAIKTCGVSCILAKSFARIFFRNALNIGLPVLESAEAAEQLQAGEEVEVDLSTGLIRALSTGQEYQSTPYPEFMQKLVEAQGLVELTRRYLAEGKF
jgi:3-isopropylmalate/(R)-2-methylmalate dehydratase small subunit